MRQRQKGALHELRASETLERIADNGQHEAHIRPRATSNKVDDLVRQLSVTRQEEQRER